MSCKIAEHRSDIVIERSYLPDLMNELNAYLGLNEFSMEVLLGEVSIRLYESTRSYIEVYSSATELTNEFEVIPLILKYAENNSFILFKKKENGELFGWKKINNEIKKINEI